MDEAMYVYRWLLKSFLHLLSSFVLRVTFNKGRTAHYIEKQMSHELTLSDVAGKGWVKVFYSRIHCQNGFSMPTRNSTCEGVVLMWTLPRLHLRVHLFAVVCPGERERCDAHWAASETASQQKVLTGLSVSWPFMGNQVTMHLRLLRWFPNVLKPNSHSKTQWQAMLPPMTTCSKDVLAQ